MTLAELVSHAPTIMIGLVTLGLVWHFKGAGGRLAHRQNTLMHIANELFFDRSDEHEWVRRQDGEFLVLKSVGTNRFSLRLRLKGVGITLVHALTGGDLGDPVFDQRWAVRVMKGEAITSLHPTARAALAAAPPEVGLTGGWLTWDGPSDPAEATAALGVLQDLQRHLENRPSIAALITSEPLASVRARAMEDLMASNPDEAGRIATAHLSDPSPEVEARMAMCVPDDARKLAVLPLLEDATLAARVVRSMSPFRFLEGVTLLAHRESVSFDAAALRVLAQQNSPEAIALAWRLGPRLAQQASEDLPFAAELHIAGLLLEDAEDENCELLPFWLTLLERGSKEARKIALRALGEHASIDVVPMIRELQGRLSWLDGGQNQAADRAVRQIQARASGDRGGLALAPNDDAGMVSVAEDPENPKDVGALSLTTEPSPASAQGHRRPRQHE
jgi:hypothetical protein